MELSIRTLENLRYSNQVAQTFNMLVGGTEIAFADNLKSVGMGVGIMVVAKFAGDSVEGKLLEAQDRRFDSEQIV